MTQALVTRINTAFGRIYDIGDAGLDYMDAHVDMDVAQMQHFYNNTLDTLDSIQLRKLAEFLEGVATDAEFELEM